MSASEANGGVSGEDEIKRLAKKARRRRRRVSIEARKPSVSTSDAGKTHSRGEVGSHARYAGTVDRTITKAR